jgi:hypothetical protein
LVFDSLPEERLEASDAFDPENLDTEPTDVDDPESFEASDVADPENLELIEKGMENECLDATGKG